MQLDAVYFDMDGTLADLYNVPNWCERITSNDASPYKDAKPLVSMEHLHKVVEALEARGVVVGVISWAQGVQVQHLTERLRE